MRRRSAVGICLAAATLLLINAPPAGSAGVKVLTLPAVAMTDRSVSEHNDVNEPNACALYWEKANTVDGAESGGGLASGTGSYVEGVVLPQGVKVKELVLFANDNDGEDVHAYLMRKELTDGLSPHTDGYEVMGEATSSGAVAATMRRFSDATIDLPTIDNAGFMYLIEVVVCGAAQPAEPFAVQIHYKRP